MEDLLTREQQQTEAAEAAAAAALVAIDADDAAAPLLIKHTLSLHSLSLFFST